MLAKQGVTVIDRNMSFASKIECARTTPEMYRGFGVPVRVLQMDIDGACAKLEQKKLGEIHWYMNP